ncbi:MAG: hypothetical protein EXR79_11965 [Myxococcales bacterium]|nr:hypothetical protein [Myxococcales bacterium]
MSCASGLGATATVPGACDDGDGCTQGEICQAGKCSGGTDVCVCALDADSSTVGGTCAMGYCF